MDIQQLADTVESIYNDPDLNNTHQTRFDLAKEVVESLDEDDIDECIADIHISELIRLMTETDVSIPTCCYEHFCRATILFFLSQLSKF